MLSFTASSEFVARDRDAKYDCLFNRLRVVADQRRDVSTDASRFFWPEV